MVYKIMNIEELDAELIKKYYPMLTWSRKKKIANMDSPDKRAAALCGEILARQCLSELLNAPEFSFRLLCNSDSLNIVGNYNASISVVQRGKYMACAASKKRVGISIVPVKPFSFMEAQSMFSDSEIRAIYSESVHSFADIVKLEKCNEKSVMRKFALFSALKETDFKSTGRGIKAGIKKSEFSFNGEQLICSDTECEISAALIDEKKQLAISVIERR